MNFIRYPTSLPANKKLSVLSQALTVIDRKLWTARYAKLIDAMASNPFASDILLREYKIEYTVGFMMKRYYKVRILPSLKMYPELHSGLEFLHTLHQVRTRLNVVGQHRLDGMVRDGLNKNRGVASVAFELATATHFIMAGYSVQFRDMEEGSGVDLVVKREGLTIEVECKHVSGDIGYPIHTNRFRELMFLQKTEIDYYTDNFSQSIALRVIIPNNLHNSNFYYDKISSLIRSALRNQQSVRDNEGNEVFVRSFLFSDSINRQNAAKIARNVMNRVFGIDNNNAIAAGGWGKPLVVIGMTSQQEPRVVERLFQQLRKSADKQLSGRMPGMICAYLSAITKTQLSSFKDRSGNTALELATQDIFERRPQLSALAFVSSDQPMWAPDKSEPRRRLLGSASAALFFNNRKAIHPVSEGAKIFGTITFRTC